MGVTGVGRVPAVTARMVNEDGSKNMTELTPSRFGAVKIVDIPL